MSPLYACGRSFVKLLCSALLLSILVMDHGSVCAIGTATGDNLPLISENQAALIYDKILFVSEKIAKNLVDNAVPDGNGYKWPIQFKSTYFNPGFHSGAAGVGTFFLLLYVATGNITYLKYAEGAANWIISVAQKNSDGSVTWCSYDDERCWFLTPDKEVSGIIKFLLQLYNTTRKDIYLNYAEKGAKWIINTALVRDRIGVYVSYNPPGQAAFGVYSYVQRDVGTLMINLYITTKDSKYLEIAKSIGDWILYTSECDQYMCKWYDDRGYVNHYSVEGTVSVADLLYGLYEVTSDHRYLQTAEKIVNWIESRGIRYIDGYWIKFPNYKGRYLTVIDGYWDRPFFPMTPADIFIKSFMLTGNTSRLDVARSFANWVILLSRIEGDHARVPFSEDQQIYHSWINARIFKFIIFLYNQTRESVYLDFASKLLNYILRTAIGDRGFVWPRHDGKIWITFGLGEGSCAIGYYLLSSMNMRSISSVRYKVDIDSSPRVEGVEVNGVRVSLPYSIWVEPGNMVNIVVPSSIPVETTPVTRKSYRFSGWSDGVTTPSRSIRVDKPLNLVAQYRLSVEHYVEVTANAREAEKCITGSGWYKEGEKARISAESVIPLSDKERLVFVRWDGLSSQTSIEVTVNSPKQLKAIYVKQFRVEVTTMDFTKRVFVDYLQENYSLGPLPDLPVVLWLVCDRFMGFEDVETGRSLGYSVIVDRPLRLVARYKRDYTGSLLLIALAIASITSLTYRFMRNSIRANQLKRNLEIYEGKVKEYRGYLEKLKQLREKGEISDEAYQVLKDDYNRELEKCEKELEELKRKLERLGQR